MRRLGRGNTARRLEWIRAHYDHLVSSDVVGALAHLGVFVASGRPPRSRYDALLPWLAREFARERTPPLSVLVAASGLPRIADWISGARVGGRRIDIGQYTWDRADAASHRWHVELAERGGRKLRRGDQGEVVFRWPDGWTLQSLAPGQLRAEGEAMGHCVGSEHYVQNVANESLVILSLRDPRGQPHATVEVNADGVEQVQGKGDSVPIQPYRDRLVDAFLRGELDEATPMVGPVRWGDLLARGEATRRRALQRFGPLGPFALGRAPTLKGLLPEAWELNHREWAVGVNIANGVADVWALGSHSPEALVDRLQALWVGHPVREEQRGAHSYPPEWWYLTADYVWPNESPAIDYSASPAVGVPPTVQVGNQVAFNPQDRDDVREAVEVAVGRTLRDADEYEARVRGRIQALEAGPLPPTVREAVLRWRP